MIDFYKSPIYLALLEKLGEDDDWEDIVTNLYQVFNDKKIPKNQDVRWLSVYFIWSHTKQGRLYWSDIAKRSEGW